MTREERLAAGHEFTGYAFKVGALYICRDDVTRLTRHKVDAMRRHTLDGALAVRHTIVGHRYPTMRIVSLWRPR